MITSWQAVLRALVYDAYAKRESGDGAAFSQAVVEIVETWYRWPLIVHRQAIIEARLEHEQREADYADWLDWLADRLDAMGLDSASTPTGAHRARPNLSDSPLPPTTAVKERDG